jgi:hypothetical protein
LCLIYGRNSTSLKFKKVITKIYLKAYDKVKYRTGIDTHSAIRRQAVYLQRNIEEREATTTAVEKQLVLHILRVCL